MIDPSTVEEWLKLVEQHEVAARALSEHKVAAAQGYFHAGLAVECALKAYIFRRERFNSWPSKESREDLYTHDLRRLVAIAGIELTPNLPTAAGWHIVLQWDRNQGYDPKPMPRKVARSMVEAVFGAVGVVRWIRLNLSPERLEAGKQYLAALRELGFEPYALFWAYDKIIDHFVLVLVTELFDFKGPYEISKLLFKAYNAAATPMQIDPFLVRLHSHNHSIVSEFMTWMGGGLVSIVDDLTGLPGKKSEYRGGFTKGLMMDRDWALKKFSENRVHPYRYDPTNLSRKWARFERTVAALAA